MPDTHTPTKAPDDAAVDERLERGEILFYPIAPFALPAGDDQAFLLEQRIAGHGRKNITYNPHSGETTGFARTDAMQAQRLGNLFAAFSRSVTAWLSEAFPRYQPGLEADRATFRPEEEAIRRIRLNARNDLLHVDAFPNRPARGRRILRAYANIHPSDPRVWATSEPLPQLLSQYGKRIDRIGPGWLESLATRVRDMVLPPREKRSAVDCYMLRLHDYLKRSMHLQQKSPRRLWRFPPGSAWVAMTDGCCHADLRGQFALEHSYFVAPSVLACPHLAPTALIRVA